MRSLKLNSKKLSATKKLTKTCDSSHDNVPKFSYQLTLRGKHFYQQIRENGLDLKLFTVNFGMRTWQEYHEPIEIEKFPWKMLYV